MPINYTWVFPQFDVAKSEDGLTDVVKVIHWQYFGADGEYTASEYGTVTLGPPNPTDFIPYDQLTEQWAINAVSEQVNVLDMEARLAVDIAAQKNPPIVPMPPPFPQA